MALAAPTPVIENAGKQIANVMDFSLSTDLLQDSDVLEFTVPPSVFPSLKTDNLIRMRFGPSGNPQFTGRIYKISVTTRDDIKVRCYDTSERLVSETVTPQAGFHIGRGSLKGELERIVKPIFSEVIFSNAQDRILRRQSRRGLVRSKLEPVSRSQLKAIGRTISPATKRIRALKKVIEPLGLLAWSSADGKSLIVSEPNYQQNPQYQFIHTPRDSNVRSMETSQNIEGRFSKVVVSGSAKGQGVSPPVVRTPGVKKLPRVVMHSLGRAFDTTGDLQEERVLFVRDTSLFPEEAQKKADRILGQQIGNARPVSVSVAGFGQLVNRGQIIYATDTVCKVKRVSSDFRTGQDIPILDELYYITAVTFNLNGGDTSTTIKMVPKGTPLV